MRLMLTMLLAAVVLLPASFACAQSADDPASIWTLQDENASIPGLKTRDHFYTNGLRLGWTSPTTVVPAELADLGRAVWGDAQQRIGFDLSQQIYTPMDTQATVTNPHDRPYGGLLTGNFSLLGDTADSRRVLILTLGVLGPGAGGEDLQNGFHDVIGRPEVKGWHAQIPNTPVVELLHERTWRLPMGQVAGLETDVLPSLALGVGDLRDYVQAGATVRIGQGLDSDFGVPRLRPGLSGGDAFMPTRHVAWYAFVGADAQAVGYDLLLQAAPFRAGPHVAPLWDVAEMQAGFAVMVAGMRLTVAYVAQTAEFHGQSGGIHQFATASLSIRF
jgi:lipid A 3-O-deacylase